MNNEATELSQWLYDRCLRIVVENGQMYLVSTLDWYKYGFEYVDYNLGEEFDGSNR
jgi:hypothetical protein